MKIGVSQKFKKIFISPLQFIHNLEEGNDFNTEHKDLIKKFKFLTKTDFKATFLFELKK